MKWICQNDSCKQLFELDVSRLPSGIVLKNVECPHCTYLNTLTTQRSRLWDENILLRVTSEDAIQTLALLRGACGQVEQSYDPPAIYAGIGGWSDAVCGTWFGLCYSPSPTSRLGNATTRLRTLLHTDQDSLVSRLRRLEGTITKLIWTKRSAAWTVATLSTCQTNFTELQSTLDNPLSDWGQDGHKNPSISYAKLNTQELRNACHKNAARQKQQHDLYALALNDINIQKQELENQLSGLCCGGGNMTRVREWNLDDTTTSSTPPDLINTLGLTGTHTRIRFQKRDTNIVPKHKGHTIAISREGNDWIVIDTSLCMWRARGDHALELLWKTVLAPAQRRHFNYGTTYHVTTRD